jgi:hypothetical protein
MPTNDNIIVSICNGCNKDFNFKKGYEQLCQNCRRKAKKLAYRIACSNYKNDECYICKTKRETIDDLVMFDFHHINRETKLFEFGDNIENKNWPTIVQELDKCMMLCANCHRKQHIYQRNDFITKFAKKLITKYV